MKFDVSDKILILGYSGSGKTTLLEYFVNYYFINFPHIVIIDSVYRFSKLRDRFYFGITQCNNPKPNKICVHVRKVDKIIINNAQAYANFDVTAIKSAIFNSITDQTAIPNIDKSESIGI